MAGNSPVQPLPSGNSAPYRPCPNRLHLGTSLTWQERQWLAECLDAPLRSETGAWWLHDGMRLLVPLVTSLPQVPHREQVVCGRGYIHPCDLLWEVIEDSLDVLHHDNHHLSFCREIKDHTKVVVDLSSVSSHTHSILCAQPFSVLSGELGYRLTGFDGGRKM